MHMIAYVSDAISKDEALEQATNDIVQAAKRRNPTMGITGVLILLNGKYLQIIEGEEANLRILMKDVEGDNRHENVSYLIDTKTSARGFKDWNMDVFMLNKDLTFDAGTLTRLTESFRKNLLPRSDSLFFYYKSLLAQKTA